MRRRALATMLIATLAWPGSALAAEPVSPQPHDPGRTMAITGSVFIMTSAAGYIAMAVGLGIGNNANAQVQSLDGADALERRREAIERGTMGNRLALGAGLASVALMATGIALVVVGRRRSNERRATAGLLPLPRGAGVQLGARF